MSRLLDLTDNRYGRLLVVGPHTTRKGRTYWRCRCDCGTEAEVMSANLRTGNTRSCGCLNSETTAARNRSHGDAGPDRAPEYTVWALMLRRCTDPSDGKWSSYGGRGIEVCERWQSYENFAADMGRRPGAGYQIERIANDGNYEPGNCRWATRVENASNRRDNVFLTYAGETATLSEWARRTGLPMHALWQRIQRLHWDVERALTTPLRRR